MPAPITASSLAVLSLVLLCGAARPAAALTMEACGTLYQDAKKAGTLAGQDWNAFRTSHCPITVAAASAPPPGAVAPVTAAAVPGVPVTPAVTAPAAAKPAPPQAANPVFPGKIDAKYASLKPGRARMKTCDDQYKVNKTTGGNAGLSWLQKGGGYYSACSKHLKAL